MELVIRTSTGVRLETPETGADMFLNPVLQDLDTGELVANTSGILQGQPYFLLEQAESLFDRRVVANYRLRIGGVLKDYVTQYYIYTPYASVDKIREVANISEATATDAELVNLERIVAGKAEAITGQRFVPYYLVDYVQGHGSDVLDLSRPLLELHELYGDDELLYDYMSDDAADWEAAFHITGSRYRIRKRGTSAEHPYLSRSGYFGYDRYYAVHGIFGWAYVPTDLEYACALYVKDMTSEAVAPVEGIIEYSNDAYSVKYADSVTQGTGNTTVDSIFAKYRNYGMAVV